MSRRESRGTTAKAPAILFALLPCSSAPGAETALVHQEFTVGKLQRHALAYIPPNAHKTATPVMLIFHGHGGNPKDASETFACHRFWPQAICVYLRGLPIPSPTDPQGERLGWQQEAGDVHDRDLKFFDAVLADLGQQYKIDRHRVYAAGFSNGATFTYLLWRERAGDLAAVALLSGGARHKIKDLQPLPCLLVMGQQDKVVHFERHDSEIEALRRVNDCEDKGKPLGKTGRLVSTLYPSKHGAPLVDAVHPGGHEVPDGAGKLIVAFFKDQAKKDAGTK